MSKAKREKNEKGKAWLRRELSPYRSLIAVLSVLAVCIALASVAFAYLVRYLIDAAAEKNGKQLLFFAAVLFALLLLRILAQMLNAYQTEKCRAKMYAGMKQKLFGALLYADYAQTERYHSGDMLSRLTFDAAEVAADTTKLMPALSGGLVRGAGAFCALFALDPLFTTLYAIGAAALISLGILLRKKAKAYQREVSEAEGKSRVFMQESLGSVVTLKAYGAEQKTAEKSRLLLGEYCDKRMQKARFRACLNGGFSFLSGIGLLFAVVWCCVGIVRGRTDYGTTLSVVLLLGQLQQPLTALSSLLPLYYAREASGERLAEIDDFPGESCGISDKTESSDSFSRIAAQDLVFGYGEEKIFEGACAEFARGNIVCITGKSGAGKTTLLKLLLNIYPTESGGFFLESESCEGIRSARSLTSGDRALFAYVSQKNFLFSGSVAEILTLFAPPEGAGAEELREALTTAAAEFVYDLPQGLNTSLREDGNGLSEGQLQRLAIARALLSRRPVLLLDEATSALDEETEKRVLENLKALRNKTCLIVTHRPAALKIADFIWRIGEGKIKSQKIE
ncbi:MAG: ABC transporter ATP-binding protein, partial [Firmicutes bacterium]|nr:ABC transporter ATP-binding protein [Bacillota bacterium]